MRTITTEQLAALAGAAAARPRRRLTLNLHPTLEDPVQRLFNAFRRGSYVRPHRHTDPLRWEAFVILTGAAAVLELDGRGTVVARCDLDPDGGCTAVELEGGRWHTVVAISDAAVLFEIKPGPYSPIDDKDFAPWAHAEGEPGCGELVQWFETAAVGDRPPRSS